MKVFTLQIRVKTRAGVSELVRADEGMWLARLQSPPVDGKANKELVGLVAAKFKCPKSAVTIKSGASGRIKLVTVDR